jgi:hypothetical protein
MNSKRVWQICRALLKLYIYGYPAVFERRINRQDARLYPPEPLIATCTPRSP